MSQQKSQARRIAKIRRKYGQNAFVKFGRRGGNPVLLALKYHKPVKGYRVIHES